MHKFEDVKGMNANPQMSNPNFLLVLWDVLAYYGLSKQKYWLLVTRLKKFYC